MRKLALLVTATALAVFLVSCTSSPAPEPTPAPPPAAPPSQPAPVPGTGTPETVVIDAAKLYATNCSGCHGPTRQGVQGFAPALTPANLADDEAAELKTVITNGKSGTMPAFGSKLKAEEIDALVDFIKNTAP